MVGLVDCNNFYCSCERVFNPELQGRPVVVLSSNDGCIVARSNEAKALGIQMGVPLYQVRDFLERRNVAVFSCNFTLYGDMSRRVMTLLSEFTPNFTQYSVDEAFLDLSGFGEGDELRAYGKKIVDAVRRGTGIPVTMGIAPTKTLAKVASRYGKKYKGYGGVCMIDTEEKRVKALQGMPISDVWGIGRRSAAKLEYAGIATAWDFVNRSEGWVRKMLSITGVRTWLELRGESCIDVDELPEKRSICTSRSFAELGLSSLQDVEEAVANFAASCARKLRQQKSCCSSLTVFAYTSRFRDDLPQQAINISRQFPVPTADSRELVAAAVSLLKRSWVKGNYHYKKAGVLVWDISSDNAVQTCLFDPVDRERQARLAAAVESINHRNGHDAVKLAVQGQRKNWHLKCEHITRQYTTNLKDIIRVKLK